MAIDFSTTATYDTQQATLDDLALPDDIDTSAITGVTDPMETLRNTNEAIEDANSAIDAWRETQVELKSIIGETRQPFQEYDRETQDLLTDKFAEVDAAQEHAIAALEGADAMLSSAKELLKSSDIASRVDSGDLAAVAGFLEGKQEAAWAEYTAVKEGFYYTVEGPIHYDDRQGLAD